MCTVLTMRIRAGCERRFEAEWLTVAEKIRAFDGCLRQDLVRDVDDPRSYLIISEWADRERLDEFGRSDYREHLLSLIRELRESAQRRTYQVVHVVRGRTRVVPAETRVARGEARVARGEARVARGEARVVPGEARVVPGEARAARGEARVGRAGVEEAS